MTYNVFGGTLTLSLLYLSRIYIIAVGHGWYWSWQTVSSSS